MLLSRTSEETRQPAPTGAAPDDASSQQTDGIRRVRRLGHTVHIQGVLIADSDLSIDGRFDGRIALHHHCLSTSAASRIVADVLAKEVVVRGQLKGKIVAGERVTIASTATVDGDIRAPRVKLEPGGTVNGTIVTEAAFESSADPADPE